MIREEFLEVVHQLRNDDRFKRRQNDHQGVPRLFCGAELRN